MTYAAIAVGCIALLILLVRASARALDEDFKRADFFHFTRRDR
jgi:hypothetical protein